MKQEYLKMRLEGKFDFEFMFKYWLRNGGDQNTTSAICSDITNGQKA